MENIPQFLILAGLCLLAGGLVTSAVPANHSNATPVNETIIIPENKTIEEPVNETGVENITLPEDLTPIEEFTEITEEELLEDDIPEEVIEIPEEELIEETPITEEMPIEEDTPLEEEVIPEEITEPVITETPQKEPVKKPATSKIGTIQCKSMSEGHLTFTAPLAYYNAVAGDGGVILMGERFEGEKFILIPVD